MSGIDERLWPTEARILSLAMRDNSREARALASHAERSSAFANPDTAARIAAYGSLAAFVAAEYDAAAVSTELALANAEECEDPRTASVTAAARLLSSAGAVWASAGHEAEQRLADRVSRSADTFTRAFHDEDLLRLCDALLALEALFATGRVEQTRQLLDSVFDGHEWELEPLPRSVAGLPLPSMPMLPVRVLIFLGRIADAERLATLVGEEAEAHGDGLWSALCSSVRAFCAGSRGDVAGLTHFARIVRETLPQPRGYLTSSARAFVGFGFSAAGRIEEAAAELRTAGGPGLKRLQIADRALGMELLVGEALSRDDRAAARRWARSLLPLTPHAVARTVADRVFATIDLDLGDVDSALLRTEAAIARAEHTGALGEVARNRLLRARALVVGGRRTEAATELQEIAHAAERAGAVSDRRVAARALRGLGRRVLPEVGSGAGSLTESEVEVARLAARGFSNRAIGDALFLSPRTVQGRLTRVMAAYGVPRRAALPARLAAEGALVPEVDASLGQLTPRQRQIVALVAEGRSNAQIAGMLDISSKTVERHLSMVFVTWGVSSRSSVASTALASAQTRGSSRCSVQGRCLIWAP